METFRCEQAMKRNLLVGVVFMAAAFAAVGVEPPELEQARTDDWVMGTDGTPDLKPGPRRLALLWREAYDYSDGVYKSLQSRIRVAMPRIGTEKVVGVREGVGVKRANGWPQTTHLVFEPGGLKAEPRRDDAISAILVSWPADGNALPAAAVLDHVNGGPQKRAQAGPGFEYSNQTTRFGPALQLVVRNRSNTPRFPYQMATSRDAEAVTFGVTLYVAAADRYLEFSQISPCNGRSEAACKADAMRAMKAFTDGVLEIMPLHPASAPSR